MREEPADNKGLVYIVDDEALLLDLAKVILAQEGFRTKVFLSAEEALDELRTGREQPRLLITDYVLGRMSGIELIQEAKGLMPSLKTILLSGTVDQSFVEHQTSKPNKFLPKPYNVQNLIEAVYNVLQ